VTRLLAAKAEQMVEVHFAEATNIKGTPQTRILAATAWLEYTNEFVKKRDLMVEMRKINVLQCNVA
jgi:hypothetical protein